MRFAPNTQQPRHTTEVFPEFSSEIETSTSFPSINHASTDELRSETMDRMNPQSQNPSSKLLAELRLQIYDEVLASFALDQTMLRIRVCRTSPKP